MKARTGISRAPLFLLSLLPLAVPVAAAAPYVEYRVTVVGPAGSRPTGMNQAGAVVGVTPSGPTTYRSFVNYGSGPRDLGLLGGSSNEAAAINDRGAVLGNWTTSAGERRGYVYYRGSFRRLAGVDGRPTRFVDINNAGYILATTLPSPEPGAPNPRGYLRAPDGSYRNLGTLPYPNPTTQPEALNNRNQVTGESGQLLLPEIPLHAFVWRRGVMRQLGSFGNTPNYGLDINDRGQVAGYTATATFREGLATIWTHGRPTIIDPRPPGPGNRFSTADAINNHGHVAGNSDSLGAYVYRGRRMESLNALIHPRSGWNITLAWAINDAGQIAATAVRGGVQYAVRLDLIRPHGLEAPQIEAEDEADAGGDAQVEAGAQ